MNKYDNVTNQVFMDFIFNSYVRVPHSRSLTLCDGELIVSEYRAFRLVEGQVVDGGSYADQELLTFLHRPQVCVAPTQIRNRNTGKGMIIVKSDIQLTLF